MWTDYTFLLVIFSCALLAAVSSMVGLIVILQKESLLGDTLSHAALPGVIIAFLIAQAKITPILLFGAFASGMIAVFIIQFVKRNTTLPFDGILATILASFFGFGMVLLTYSQKLSNAAQAGLKNFIFGQASSILFSDAITIVAISCLVVIVFLLFWKEIKIFVFDPIFAQTSGVKTKFVNVLVVMMMTAVIIIELQTVGIILTSAMLIAPGVAALQWSKRFGTTVILSVFFGIISALIGTTFSFVFANVPTGPAIIVVITSIALFSVIFGKYGVFHDWLQHQQFKKTIIKGRK